MYMVDSLKKLFEYADQLKDRKSPLVPTSNGHAEVAVQDAAGNQAMVNRLEHAETISAIRQGLEQADRGEGLPLEEAEARLRIKPGFSR